MPTSETKDAFKLGYLKAISDAKQVCAGWLALTGDNPERYVSVDTVQTVVYSIHRKLGALERAKRLE